MSETTAPVPSAYASMGLIGNPFPSDDPDASGHYWQRILTHAAANRMMTGCANARSSQKPLVLQQSAPIPDIYPRMALNEVLRDVAADPGLHMLVINSTIDIMRLGTIRGPLAAVSERVAAMNLPLTVGLYFADALAASGSLELPEAALFAEDEITHLAEAFSSEPAETMVKYFGFQPDDVAPTRDEEFNELHQTYLRVVDLEKSPDEDVDRAQASDELEDAEGPDVLPPDGHEADAETPVVSRSEVREYLLALMRVDLSPVVARAISKFHRFGPDMVAQELRVTKGPRKTLEAVLKLASHRWSNFVFLWGEFEAWPALDQQTKMDVAAALFELRWIFGKYGVMAVTLNKGIAPELDEAFGTGVVLDVAMPGMEALSRGDRAWDEDLVQSWLDSAAVSSVSEFKIGDPMLRPLIEAADGDVVRFAGIAQAAFADGASRGLSALDADAIAAGVASETEVDA